MKMCSFNEELKIMMPQNGFKTTLDICIGKLYAIDFYIISSGLDNPAYIEYPVRIVEIKDEKVVLVDTEEGKMLYPKMKPKLTFDVSYLYDFDHPFMK